MDKPCSFKLCLLGGAKPEAVINNVIPTISQMGAEPTSKIKEVRYILVHRNTVARTGTDLAKWFQAPGAYQSRCPYHFLVRRDGTVDWMVSLDKATPGAKDANPYSIQIAVDWDMHKSKLPDNMYASLLAVTAFCLLMEPKAAIQGHMEEDPLGRSSDPKKDCPGKHFDMAKLRKDVKELTNG